MTIVISSGHGKIIRGAEGLLDEVDEARKVVNQVAAHFDGDAIVFHDDESKSQSDNLRRIVDFHNSHKRDLDVSIHFNAFNATEIPMGCEVLHLDEPGLAKVVADKICAASGLKNRGAKKRTNLFFLNKTNEPAILIEICFVDSSADARIYHSHFEAICKAIADGITET